jgi:hypothetical protein
MPDLSAFLNRPAGRAVRPPPLPPETYPGVIRDYEYGESAQNKTPYVRYQVVLLDWPPSVPQDKRAYKDRQGNMVPIDLSRVRLRRDMYMTEEALWRLDDLFRSCGVDTDSGREYAELCPQLVGCQVSVEVQQYINPNNNEIGNQIGRMYGPHNPA